MIVREMLSVPWAEADRLPSFATLLREHGVDLVAIDPEELPLQRGTPVYVDADADYDLVHRRMVLAHVRLLFVLDGHRILGVVDLVDLATRAAQEGWMQDLGEESEEMQASPGARSS